MFRARNSPSFWPITISGRCCRSRASRKAWRIRTTCSTPTRATIILTLYEKRVAEADLPFFIGLMEHLAARGLNCPQPVKNRAGSALGRLAGRAAAIVTYLEGLWPRRQTAAHCAAVGAALAELHIDGEGFALTRPERPVDRRLAAALPDGRTRARTMCSLVSRPSSKANSTASTRTGRAACRRA